MKKFVLLLLVAWFSQVYCQETVPCRTCIGGATNGQNMDGCYSTYISGQHIPLRNNASWMEIFSENFSNQWVDHGNYIQFGQDPNLPAWNSPYHNLIADDPAKNPYVCYKRDNLNTDISNGWLEFLTKYEPGTLCGWGYDPNNQVIRDYTMPFLTPCKTTDGNALSFGPGKFEIKCKLPVISAQWPSFWLYENNIGPEGEHKQEIDLFEVRQDPLKEGCNIDEENPDCMDPSYAPSSEAGKRMIMTSHYRISPSDSECSPQMCYINSIRLDAEWHTYTLIWDEDIIEWYFDGNLVHSRSRFFYFMGNTYKDLAFPSSKIEMQLIVSSTLQTLLPMGDYTSSDYVLPSCEAPLTTNPWLIDYVRIWKRSCGTGNRQLCFDYDPFTFFDPDDAIVKAQTIETLPNCSVWHVDNGQNLRLGATDEIKLVNFEARLGSEFIATIEGCDELEYRNLEINNENTSNNTTASIIEAFNNKATQANASLQENSKLLSVLPNPNPGEFIVSIQSPTNNKTNLCIIDLSGRILYTQSTSLQEGLNQIQMSQPELPAGIYFIRIDGFDEQLKMIIAK